MSDQKEYSGVAALAIFESLILSLKERDIISSKEADNVLSDAIAALRHESDLDGASPAYAAAVQIIEKIQKGTNGVRHIGPATT